MASAGPSSVQTASNSWPPSKVQQIQKPPQPLQVQQPRQSLSDDDIAPTGSTSSQSSLMSQPPSQSSSSMQPQTTSPIPM